jgi:WD40 repeat protein
LPEKDVVTKLRLVPSPQTDKHEGEVFSCTFTPDGGFVLSAGWDGHLRLWETSTGTHLTALRAGLKPLSACAVTPDGRQWVAGSLEGLLTFWDASTHALLTQYAGHTRPVSSICFAAEQGLMATASWDRSLCLSKVGPERNVRGLFGHADIVAGCQFLHDGATLLSWSHDATLRLWDVESGQQTAVLTGHQDRVTAAAASPEGRWAVSGSREGELLLWDLETSSQVGSVQLADEVCGSFFLLDGNTLLTVDTRGHVILFSLPALQPQSQLSTQLSLQCAALSAGGMQLALGDSNGQICFVVIEGLEDCPLLVTARRSQREVSGGWQRLLGRRRVASVFHCTCPSCHRPIEWLENLPPEPVPCPHCRQALRHSAGGLSPPAPTRR